MTKMRYQEPDRQNQWSQNRTQEDFTSLSFQQYPTLQRSTTYAAAVRLPQEKVLFNNTTIVNIRLYKTMIHIYR